MREKDEIAIMGSNTLRTTSDALSISTDDNASNLKK